MQDRIGPNRVGPFGLLQPLADGLKFLLKEDVDPGARRQGSVSASRRRSRCSRRCWRSRSCRSGRSNRRAEWLRFIIAPNVDIGIVFIFAVTQPGGVRRDPRRLGVEQQVQRARLAAGECPGRELRDSAGHVGAGRRAAGRHAEPGEDSRPAGRRAASGTGTSGTSRWRA